MNPTDNRSLKCYVKEYKIDNDFKFATYPAWSEIDFILRSNVCKAKELYYNVITEERIKNLPLLSSLNKSNLHRDMAEITKRWVSDIRICSEAYASNIRRTLDQFTQKLGPTCKIDDRVSEYLKEAQDKRDAQFEVIKKRLKDDILCQPSPRENLSSSMFDESLDSYDTTRENTRGTDRQPQLQKLDWSDYKPVHFVSKKSKFAEPAAAQIQEEEDQVSSVN